MLGERDMRASPRILLVIVILLGTPGCPVDVALKAVDSVPRAVSEASRMRESSKWAGRYAFSECAPDATQRCWTYVVDVGRDGNATVRADGEGLAVHVRSKPEVDEGALLLPFDSYIDGAPDRPLLHLPGAEKIGFEAGDLLGGVKHDRSGRPCLVLRELRSPIGSRVLCVQPSQ
jgi:hypothetical protein